LVDGDLVEKDMELESEVVLRRVSDLVDSS
jgi:hypothetical protein